MQEVVIITGSGHGLTEEMIKEYGIRIFSYGIRMGDKWYKDGIDINVSEMIKMINDKNIIPKTSPPAIADIIDIIKSINDEGKFALFVPMSASFSTATYETINNARKKTGIDIGIIDTLQVSQGKELIVLEAARLAKAGKSREEIEKYLEKLIAGTNAISGVPDLKYLHNSGRIGRARVLMGSMMKVIPMIAVRDMEGSISPIGRARSMPKVNQKIVDTIKDDMERANAKKVKIIAIAHAENPEAAQALKKSIDDNIDYEEIFMMELGCASIAHPGPQMWGASYYIEKS